MSRGRSAHPFRAKSSPIFSRPTVKLKSHLHDQEQDSLGMSLLELRARGLMQSLSREFLLWFVFRWQVWWKMRVGGVPLDSGVKAWENGLGRWLAGVYALSGIDNRSGNGSRLSPQPYDELRQCGLKWEGKSRRCCEPCARLYGDDCRREQRECKRSIRLSTSHRSRGVCLLVQRGEGSSGTRRAWRKPV